jgi:hypothetical protein
MLKVLFYILIFPTFSFLSFFMDENENLFLNCVGLIDSWKTIYCFTQIDDK